MTEGRIALTIRGNSPRGGRNPGRSHKHCNDSPSRSLHREVASLMKRKMKRRRRRVIIDCSIGVLLNDTGNVSLK
jgi:hypothetical protein